MAAAPSDPLLSVVIPTYNRGSLIGETLESVFAQTYRRLEVIVVDDGSTDDTEAVVGRFQGRVIYIRQQNQGLAASRNTGLGRATGEFVAWQDSDDLWNPDKTAVQLGYLRRRPETVCIGSDFSAFSADGFFERSHVRSYYGVIDRAPRGLDDLFSDQELVPAPELPYLSQSGGGLPEAIRVYSGQLYETLVQGNCLHPPTVMFRRDAAAQAGPLDGTFRRDADWEWLLRISRIGRCAYVDHPLMRYRLSPGQMSGDAQAADIALSRVQVLEALKARDPDLLGKPFFRPRLGYAHLAAANALAESAHARAAGHLFRSIGWGYLSRRTVTTLAKICAPGWAIRTVRQLRNRAAGA
jgi:glycosyltransferase involved in cell wall biosynthesis